MKRSHNEVAGMAIKAARGAGVPLGHAEEFGAAFAYLAQTQSGVLPQVVAALAQDHGPVEMTLDADNATLPSGQAIMCGPIIRDTILAGANTVRVEQIDLPELLSAYCALSGGMTVKAENGIRVQSASVAATPALVGPISVDADVWDRLNAFAERTYVPATEASRLAGAGAGLTDND